MPFGSLSGAQQILVRLYLRGGPQYRAELVKSGIATDNLTAANARLGRTMAATTKRTFMHNQALFMARRGLFYATLGFVGLGAAVARLGFQYNNTLQQATVAFKGFLGSEAAATRELQKLYVLAAKTPFEFPDIVLATRRLLPFTSGIDQARQVVEAIMDSLSAMGILTASALTRASLAMAHMFSVGRLTGQILYQLGRDNIPMMQALMHYFHATGEEIREQVAGGLISATQAATALSEFMQTPGFKGAAFAQATETLQGAWTTFVDILRIAMGSSEKGMFTGLTKLLQDIDRALLPLIEGDKPVTLLEVVKAIDSQLSPASHVLLNIFIFMRSFLMGLVGTFYALYKVLTTILWPINKLGNLFGAAGLGAKVLGMVIGVLTAAVLVNKAALGAWAIAAEVAALKQLLLRDAIATTTVAMKAQTAFAAVGGFFGGGGGKKVVTQRTPAWKSASGMLEIETAVIGGGGAMAKFATAAKFMRLQLAILVVELMLATTAVWAFTIALLANPITWIVVGVVLLIGALVILYRKWDRFHWAVVDTFEFMKKNWEWFVFAIPVIGPLIVMGVKLVKVFNWFGDALERVSNWLAKIGSQIPGIPDVPGWLKSALQYSALDLARDVGKGAGGAGRWLVTEDIKKRQHGGFMFGSGMALVGERGPELVRLPGGANVIPNNKLGVESLGLGGRRTGGENGKPIIVQVMLDRKVLAQGVARANQDYAARR